MFERFSNVARDVMAESTVEAKRLGATAIGPEHILIALASKTGVVRYPVNPIPPERLRAALAECDPEASALATLGISLPDVRRAVEEAFGPDAFECDGKLAFRADAKRALERALRATADLKLRSIDASALLLGLLADPNPATELLEHAGVDPAALYAQTRSLLGRLAS